jgi:hypothetical protein
MTKFILKYAWAFWAGAALTGFFGITISNPDWWLYIIVLNILVALKDLDEDGE